MKHSFRVLCAVLLLLSPCFALVSASAQSAPFALQITGVELVSGAGSVTLHVTLYNAGSDAIDQFAFAIAFYDGSGDRLYGYGSTLEDYQEEVCNWFYTPDNAIAPGGTFVTTDTFAAYAGAADVAVAIRYCKTPDGVYTQIPESEWQWLSPGSAAVSASANLDTYTSPSEAVNAAISGFVLGYQYSLLDDYNAAHYGKSQGGYWITSVAADSPAARAGLEAGDLICSVNGVKPTENVYIGKLAKADIINGAEADWVYERGGALYTVRFTKP